MRVVNGAFAAATLVTAAVGGQLGPARLGETRAGATPAEGRAVVHARAGAGDEVRAQAGAGEAVVGRAHAGAAAHAGRRGGGHVYVWNLYGDERGRRDERPAGLVVSEHASLTHLHWSGWGGAGASGTGRFSGTMCMPDCLKRPYPASVTLGRIRTMHGARYYTGFKVKVKVPEHGQGPSALNGTLPTP